MATQDKTKIIDTAVEWAEKKAADPGCGYSQQVRWGPDYDCSSFVISAYEAAGLPLRECGASYTGNMFEAFTILGFSDVRWTINLATGEGLQKGDVLLNNREHTCLYVGGGKVANARTNEDGLIGDSTGQEVRIQPYFNFSSGWDHILRYRGDGNVSAPAEPEVLIPNGTKGLCVAMLQGGLKYLGYSLGWYGIDGDAGTQNSYTNKALRQAVAAGKISKDTIQYLLKITGGKA